MESTRAPNVIQFPAFEAGLDDGDSNVVSILNCAAYRNQVDPYAGLEEAARRAAVEADSHRDLRIMRWQSRVKWFAILTAYAAIIYFALQLGRGAF